MTQFRFLKKSAVWLLIFILGLAAGLRGAKSLQERMLANLAAEAAASAAAFTPADLAALRGNPADAGAAPYIAVKDRLRRLAQANPRVRLLYLLRHLPGPNRVVFLADSQPEGAVAALRPGDPDPGAARSAGLQQAIRDLLPSAEPPNPAGSDPLVLAFAPVSGDDLLGAEFSAGDWTGRSVVRGAEWAAAVWAVLGLPLVGLLISRQHREQRSALRNLLAALEQSHSAVMVVNLAGRIEYANSGLLRQTGHSRREILGRLWREFLQGQAQAGVVAEMEASVRAGRAWSGEWTNRRKSEELYPVRGTITPVKNRRGRPAGFVAAFDDMTEIRRNEATLRAALDRAESGDRTKSRFLATMSHEVRTPLNGIVGFTGLLLETALTPEQAEYVQTIRTSGEALIQLTSDILDFARIESGSMKLELQPANPRSCVEDTLDLLAVQAAHKGIELLHWVEDDVPAVVMADDSRLRQVLVNLVNNAVKFTAKGVVEVTVATTRVEQAGGAASSLLTFAIRDTGIGIAPADADRLFKPFRQVDESTTRRHGGSGLGLAISKNLVELMGGNIGFKSAVGVGSTFTFTIPAAEVTAAPKPPARIGPIRIALAAAAGPFRGEFERLAQRWGVTLLEFDSPAELPAEGWDLAFVDLGEAEARRIAGQPVPWPSARTHALVPVVLPSELRVALRSSFCQLLNKPLHHEAVASLLAGFRPIVSGRPAVREFGLNVLVVEDNLVNQRLVQKLLRNLGCKAVVAANGRIALENLAAATSPYDVVLMDLHMPELDGVGAIEKIRAGEAGEAARGLWITVLTADARATQKEKVMGAGANDYLVKPVSLGELANSLERFLLKSGLVGQNPQARSA